VQADNSHNDCGDSENVRHRKMQQDMTQEAEKYTVQSSIW